MRKQITVDSEYKRQVLNVTKPLTELVEEAGREAALALLYLPHTSAALILCEDDAELREDLVKVADEWLADLRPFKHIRKNNPNTEAHVLSAMAGTSVIIPIVQGKLDLGTYQSVLLLELDGPKKREIRCHVVG